MTTQQLIPVVLAPIGNQTVQTVDGRTLHTFLEVSTQFKDWIVRRIEEYGFIDGQDFAVFDRSNLSDQTGRGGDRRSKDYALTIDMAKELSMVERNAKGKQARQYFIECERRLMNQALPSHQPITDALVGQLEHFFLDRWREQGKVLVNYRDLVDLANKAYALRNIVGYVGDVATRIEAQIGQPLLNRTGDASALTDPRAAQDAFQARVTGYLVGKTCVTVPEVIAEALHQDPQDRSLQTRVGAILRRLGWTAKQETTGERKRYYVRGTR